LNEETILALGQFCKDLLDAEAFKTMQALFHQQMAADILKTASHETKAREQIYAANMGFNSFTGLLGQFAGAYEKLMETHVPPDHLDIIDDPSVHDIYSDEE
jgi:hypothetical protein